jgi:thiol-disulfide isomerase/thioredoxin
METMRVPGSGRLSGSLRCLPMVLAWALVMSSVLDPAIASEPAAAAPALIGLNGASTDLRRYRGRVILLNFWATWCAPCRQEMPALDRLSGQLDPRRAVIVGVAADERALVAPFVAKLGIHYPIAVGDPDQMFAWTASLGNVTEGLPFSVLLDGGGNVRWIQSGTVRVADVKDRIEQLAPPISNQHDMR